MFEPLQRLFRSDQAKVRYALGILERVLREDMERLGQVRGDRDRAAIARLAHKIKSGCMQVGRHRAADAMLALEEAARGGASDDDGMDRELDAANEEIRKLLVDIDGYLKGKEG